MSERVLEAFARSDVGQRRSNNEDRIVSDTASGLFIVCDGMGGHAAGEVAAGMAADSLQKDIGAQAAELHQLLAGDDESQARAVKRIEAAVIAANHQVYTASVEDPPFRGMGTTLTLLFMSTDWAIVAQVGDSRLYMVREGEANQVTVDHTIRSDLLRAGRLGEWEDKDGRDLGALTRAVGVHPVVQVDTLMFQVFPGDVFLLCSDGLHGYFDDLDLAEFIHRSSRPLVAENLIEMANRRGGHDNVSAIVIYVPQEGEKDRKSEYQLTLETVKSIPLFHYLSFAELLRVLRYCHGEAVDTEVQLIEEDQVGSDFFIILEGSVRVHRRGVELSTLGPGRYFGEMALIDNRPRSASVTMVEPGRLIRIPRSAFYEMLRGDSIMAVKILWNFIQTLSGMVRANNDTLSQSLPGLSAALIFGGEDPVNEEKD